MLVMTLIRCNASVIAVDCSAKSLAELEAVVTQAGGVLESIMVLDVTDVEATNAVVEAATAEGETPIQVSFQWKNPDFLLKNPDFLLKNVDFIIKTGGRNGRS